MNRYQIILWACLALVGFALIVSFVFPVGVLARQVFATVTATFIPPSVTPTPFNSSCPVGTPAGWGTYTPSPLWDIECGSCAIITTPTLTVTPSPVPTWSGTGTPPPTASVTPTVSVTPTLFGGITPTLSASDLSFYRVIPGGSCPVNVYSCSDYANGLKCDFDMTTSTGGGSWCIQKYNFFDSRGVDYDDYFITVDVLADTVYGYSTGINWQGFANNTFSTSADPSVGRGSVYLSSFPIRIGSYDNYQEMQISFANAGNAAHFSGSFYIMPQPVISTPSPVTPVFTPTPFFDIGYCSSIAPPLSDFGFDLFVPDGEPFCDLGWEAFEAGTVTMPKVKICFQPSAFGVITMFSYDYEIGTLGLAIAAAFIWRFMRTV